MKSKIASLLICFFFFSSADAAVTLINEKVSDIESLRELARSSESNAVCAETTAVTNTFVCVYKRLSVMNKTFTRIGFFTGTAANYPKGTLISNNNPVLDEYFQSISGHALLGADISPFYQQALTTTQKNKRATPLEIEFLNSVIRSPRISSLGQNYVVIALTNQSKDFKEVYNHEIYHAKFYLQPKFQSVIISFWNNSISESDKSDIRSTLGQFYNAKDDRIIIDEFQAFLLESNSHDNPMSKYIRKYKPALLQQLQATGS